ncbi:hypothetical protein [Desulfosarcina cetonica]|nr:hypothetical protein [Desulfosarcina cetonica]
MIKIENHDLFFSIAQALPICVFLLIWPASSGGFGWFISGRRDNSS